MIFYLYILIQIIFESLPVSSSGHVALLERVLHVCGIHTESAYIWIWDFLLHGPTVIVLFVYFFQQWWNMVIHESYSFNIFFKRSFWKNIIPVLVFIGIVDAITFVWWMQEIKIVLPLFIGFIITASLLYSTQYIRGSYNCTWSISHAIILGCAQACSLIPGVSRFATTYTVGSFLGYKPKVAFAVSFLIQMPLIGGAFLKGFIASQKNLEIIQILFDFKVLFVILSSTLLSYKVLQLVGKSIQKGSMWKFYRYMIFPIALSIVL